MGATKIIRDIHNLLDKLERTLDAPKASVLEVPYISQVEDGALQYHNDCGAASMLMVLRYFGKASGVTVDDIYEQTGAENDEYLSVSQLQRVAREYGLRTRWQVGASIDSITQYIDGARPCIVLFNYKVFRHFVETESAFSGEHFSVVVGYNEDKLYIHDPLWSDNGGELLAVKKDDFLDAWDASKLHGNPVRGMLVPNGFVQDYLYKAKVINIGSSLNIRSMPSLEGDVIGGKPNGAKVTVYEEEQGPSYTWAKIGERKWVANDWLEKRR